MIATPVAPMPVQAAYATLMGSTRTACARMTNEAISPMMEIVVGTSLVKPCEYLRPMAQTISSKPARSSNPQAVIFEKGCAPTAGSLAPKTVATMTGVGSLMREGTQESRVCVVKDECLIGSTLNFDATMRLRSANERRCFRFRLAAT